MIRPPHNKQDKYDSAYEDHYSSYHNTDTGLRWKIGSWVRPMWDKTHFYWNIVKEKQLIYGGERGIRTLGSIATTHAFQAGAFNHSATSPAYISYDLSH